MGKLENKVAVVTGASKGIGAAITRRLAAHADETGEFNLDSCARRSQGSPMA